MISFVVLPSLLQLRLRVPRTLEASCLGAAVLWGTGAHIFMNPIEAAKRMVKVVEGEKPLLSIHQRYHGYYRLFSRLYLKLFEIFD